MNRLTMKLDEPIKTKYLNYEYNRIPDYDIVRGNFGRISDDMIFNKLGRLEDIEDELGCPLDVVFKALKDGIYCYDSDNEEIRKFITHFQYNSTSKEYYWYGNNIHFPNLKDYKKTWWLKGDLSE